MKCPRCNSNRVLTEGLDDGRVKVVCQECSYSTVLDKEGRQMLTDDQPVPDRREYLTEG